MRSINQSLPSFYATLISERKATTAKVGQDKLGLTNLRDLAVVELTA